MAEQRHAGAGIHDEPTGKALKRRGILAAAGAMVAGMMARNAAQPVAATGGGGADGNLILGSNDTDNSANYVLARTQVVSGQAINPIHGFRGTAVLECSSSPFASVQPTDANVVGIAGISRGTAAGVYGSDYAPKPSGYPANMNAGVYGYTATSGHSGVHGEAAINSNASGVFGSGFNGVGVYGISAYNIGVFGTAFGSTSNTMAGVYGTGHNIGVEGNIPASVTVADAVAVRGINASPAANGVGVRGQCDAGYGVLGGSANGIGVFGSTNGAGQVAGVYGVSNASYGVIGVSTAAGYSGLTAITGTAGVAALAATSTVSNAYAAYFTGTTVVQGDFIATGGVKSAAVRDASGQHRLVYCVESPEAWFEDFGTGRLVDGKASVALDKTFAAIVHTAEYYVFPVSHDATNKGLAVTGRTATGFVVEEQHGGRSSGTFAYRVVAKRADVKGERLATFALSKINHPDPDRLPKPESPRKQ